MSVLGKKPYVTSVIDTMRSWGYLENLRTMIDRTDEPTFFDLTLGNVDDPRYPSHLYYSDDLYYALVKLDNALSLKGYLFITPEVTTLFATSEQSEEMIIVDITATNTEHNYRIIEESLDINEFRRELSGVTGTSGAGGSFPDGIHLKDDGSAGGIYFEYEGETANIYYDDSGLRFCDYNIDLDVELRNMLSYLHRITITDIEEGNHFIFNFIYGSVVPMSINDFLNSFGDVDIYMPAVVFDDNRNVTELVYVSNIADDGDEVSFQYLSDGRGYEISILKENLRMNDVITLMI